MQDERIFPFLFGIGCLIRINTKLDCDACPEISMPSDTIIFPQLEDVYLPWQSPVPWQSSLLNKVQMSRF